MMLAPSTMTRHPKAQELLLLTHDNTTVLVAWTLAFEMYFYFVVTLVLAIAPKRLYPVLMGWSALTIAAITYSAFVPTNWDWYEGIPQSPLILEFIFGVAIAWFVRNKMLPFGVTTTFLGCAGLMIGPEIIRANALEALPPLWRVLCFGAPAALIVYGVVAIEIRKGWTFPAFWQSLGDSSYSLYLWHHLLLVFVMGVFSKLALTEYVPGPILVAVGAAIVFPTGYISYRYLERPMTVWLTSRLTPSLVTERGPAIALRETM